MRLYFLYLFILALAIYAWRDWFISLCGLVLLTSILSRKDWPYSMIGVPGDNPWNMLLVMIIAAWLVDRYVRRYKWDLTWYMKAGIACFVLVISVAVIRASMEFRVFEAMIRGTWWNFFSTQWINPLKYLLLGVMFYDGARTRERMLLGLFSVLAVFMVWAFFTIKFMPLSILLDESDFMRYRYKFDRDIGVYATDLGMVFAGAFWVFMAIWPLFQRWWYRVGVIGGAAVVLLGLGLTHARGGYMTFGALGLVFAMTRWRWLLPLMPVAVAGVFVAMPSAYDRLIMGFGTQDVTGAEVTDMDEVTSGRTTYLWPNAADEILERPLLGAGRMAILHTSMFRKVVAVRGDCPTHPHSAYLELLMDAGVLGFIPIILIYLGLFYVGLSLFRQSGDPLKQAIGGAAAACSGMLLVAGIASQTFFGVQLSTVCIWLAGGLALRLWVFGIPPSDPMFPLRIAAVAIRPRTAGAQHVRSPELVASQSQPPGYVGYGKGIKTGRRPVRGSV
jgi:O-antigen ligase